jgi:hypothetical protein
VKLAGDQQVGPGGVKLSTRNGQVDATIETQLANVARMLTGRGPTDCDRDGTYVSDAKAMATNEQ